MKRWAIIGVPVLLLAILAAAYVMRREAPPAPVIASFEDCVNAGYPVMESYPPSCIVPSGQTFTEDIGNESGKGDLIRVDSPRPSQPVASPLVVTGQARGTWFFEASFPVKLVAADGTVLAQAPAQAQGDWMTTEFVPFSVTLQFSAPTSGQAMLILAKDNPSGDPAKDDSLQVPVTF
jgi:hypothetical protein